MQCGCGVIDVLHWGGWHVAGSAIVFRGAYQTQVQGKGARRGISVAVQTAAPVVLDPFVRLGGTMGVVAGDAAESALTCLVARAPDHLGDVSERGVFRGVVALGLFKQHHDEVRQGEPRAIVVDRSAW